MKYILEPNRIYLSDENGKILAEVNFETDQDANAVVIKRVFTDPSLRGQGIASELLEKLVQMLQKDGKKAVPQCPYAVKWFEKHPQYREVL